MTRLEEDFATYIGKKYALAVNSCSSAIFLSLLSLGVKPGDKVIIPAFTFAAVPSAVIHAGAVPVLIEVGDNYCVDIDDLRIKLTPDIKVVLISHMRGHISNMEEIQRICHEKSTPLVEDAAHSLGAYWGDRKSGSFGEVGCFSFQSYKLLNSGEGGILVTDNEELYVRAVIMSGAYEKNWKKHQQDSASFSKYEKTLPVYNMRFSNLSALIVRSQISEIENRAEIGAEKVAYLESVLSRCKYISFPKAYPQVKRAPDSIQFTLKYFTDEEAEKLMGLIREKGVSLYVFGLHEGNARVFWNWEFLSSIPVLPKTRKMLMRVCDARVPLHFTKEKLDVVANVILDSVYQIKENE